MKRLVYTLFTALQEQILQLETIKLLQYELAASKARQAPAQNAALVNNDFRAQTEADEEVRVHSDEQIDANWSFYNEKQ